MSITELPEFMNNKQKLIALYCAMVKTRLFDAKAVILQRTGKLGTYPSLLGQEAVGVGIGAAMQSDDIFCPYYRDCGTQFWRNVKMVEILLYWGGDERGSDFKNNRQDFPICVPVASQTLHAVGVAAALKYKQESRVVVTVIGDGGTSRGDFYEAMNLAGVWQLPIVFVINNNQWAISVRREEQTAAKTLADKGVAAGIKNRQIDGNDVVAVYNAVNIAITAARTGGGPSLIEAVTYRMSDHTTADDANRYRKKEELETHRLEDPLLRLKQYLMANNDWDEAKEQLLQTEVTTEVEAAIAEYLNVESMEPVSMFEHLYETLPESLRVQKTEFLKSTQSQKR